MLLKEHILFFNTFSILLLLYAVPWSYKNASIDILVYITFYIINAMKKHRLSYTTFVLTIQKRSRWNLAVPVYYL